MKATSAVLCVALCCVVIVGQISLTDKYFDSNGVRIRYVDAGSGVPIILGAWLYPQPSSRLG